MSVEPERARACPNYPRACFEPELFTNKNAKIRVRAYFEPFGKLGSLSLEPGAYLLRAKISARASEPEPRLVPLLVPLSRGVNCRTQVQGRKCFSELFDRFLPFKRFRLNFFQTFRSWIKIFREGRRENHLCSSKEQKNSR